MTIDEAKINLLSLHKCLEADTDSCFLDAIKLGIEALHREADRRRCGIPDKVNLLPGETE